MNTMNTATPPITARPARIASIDALRGLVMIVMLLDHVRETFFLHLQVTDPMTLPGTPAAVFFSRLAAHLCAPVFVFLTGLSAWLHANPDGAPPRDVRGFLLKRGLLLIGLELTLVNFAWAGRFDVLYLQVIWAIGFSMLALALLSRLPRWALVTAGLVIVGGHNALAGLVVPPDSPWHAPWTLMLHRDWLAAEGALRVRVSYPALPWVGVILLGFAMGPLFSRAQDPLWRRRALLAIATLCLAALAVLRGLLHLYVLLVLYRALLAVFGPNQGMRLGVDAEGFPLIWLIWIALVPLLYPPVKAFAAYKRRTHRAWVKYS
jgi:uncharacterized membrane protein